MSNAISMLLFLATLLFAAGAYGVHIGTFGDRRFGPFVGRDAQFFGVVHILVGVWLVFGAATHNPELKFGACLMVTKSKPCSWSSPYYM